jgi:hypothetical protein
MNQATFTKSSRSGLKSDDHGLFYLARDASETGQKCKNEHLPQKLSTTISLILLQSPTLDPEWAAEGNLVFKVVDNDAVGCLP